jgi:hypothetical protein
LLAIMAGRLRGLFMLRHVAKIYMYFQGSTFVVGGSTQHGRNMEDHVRMLCRQ